MSNNVQKCDEKFRNEQKNIEINNKICLIIICPFLNFLHYNSTVKNCQEKLYDKNRQTTTLVIIPITSPINAATKINLVFFTFIQLV